MHSLVSILYWRCNQLQHVTGLLHVRKADSTHWKWNPQIWAPFASEPNVYNKCSCVKCKIIQTRPGEGEMDGSNTGLSFRRPPFRSCVKIKVKLTLVVVWNSMPWTELRFCWNIFAWMLMCARVHIVFHWISAIMQLFNEGEIYFRTT